MPIPLEDELITIFCIVDDILNVLKIKDHPQAKMSSSEIITTAIVSSLYFGCNHRRALSFMALYCKYVLSEGRFSRRLRKLTEEFDLIFNAVVLLLSSFYPSQIEEYAIDSFP